MRNLIIFAALAVGLCLPSSSAGVVAPKKPSDLRTLTGSGAACPGAASLRAVDVQLNPDGTNAPFSIPDKHVLVVTSFDVQASGSAGASAEVGLFVSNGTGGLSERARCGGIVGSNGFASASCAIPNGAAVKAGSTLCSAGVVVNVRGFLAKDK
jgi:hypothetical protein